MAALQSTPQSATELPRFDGQLMNLGGWLRALRQQETFFQVISRSSPNQAPRSRATARSPSHQRSMLSFFTINF
jgi:hypothetical protein